MFGILIRRKAISKTERGQKGSQVVSRLTIKCSNLFSGGISTENRLSIMRK